MSTSSNENPFSETEALIRGAAKLAESLGIKLRKLERSEFGGTLVKFQRDHPKGKFILTVARHAFALIDGVVHDTWFQADGRRIKGAWEVLDE